MHKIYRYTINFVGDFIAKDEIRVEYVPTDQ